MPSSTVDAVVIGAGQNGLVSANVLADAGWEVLVLEAQQRPGGAVRTEELTLPGFRHDVFSAFYPLAAASPAFRTLGLEEYGLKWRWAPVDLAHPTPDGRCVTVSRGDVDGTAASLDAYAVGDGESWRNLYDRWCHLDPLIIDALMGPFPPVRPIARIATRLGPSDMLRLARLGALTVRRLAEEEFDGEGAALFLAGCALHTDLTPESAISAFYGWLLAALAQQVGFPVPAGGAQELVTALVKRLESKGGALRTATPVEAVLLDGRRAVGVRTAGGETVHARHAVIADVDAPTLFNRLVGEEHLAPGFVDDLRRFHWDQGTVKIDWAIRGEVPWTSEPCRRAGTIHLADSLDDLTRVGAALTVGEIPERPFILVGQQSKADPTRAPAGHEAVWAYTHVAREPRLNEVELQRLVDCVEEEVERRAPGFRDTIIGRHVLAPWDMESRNSNLSYGAINAGTSQLHQQLVFRPVANLARPETPIRGLYLGSASAHPGGGVHGGPGNNAARAALLHHRFRRVRRALPRRG